MNVKKYKNRKGAIRYKAVMVESEAFDLFENSNEGFCIACGYVQDGCEPDMDKGQCEDCGESKVYAYHQLNLMGLVEFESEVLA